MSRRAGYLLVEKRGFKYSQNQHKKFANYSLPKLAVLFPLTMMIRTSLKGKIAFYLGNKKVAYYNFIVAFHFFRILFSQLFIPILRILAKSWNNHLLKVEFCKLGFKAKQECKDYIRRPFTIHQVSAFCGFINHEEMNILRLTQTLIKGKKAPPFLITACHIKAYQAQTKCWLNQLIYNKTVQLWQITDSECMLIWKSLKPIFICVSLKINKYISPIYFLFWCCKSGLYWLKRGVKADFASILKKKKYAQLTHRRNCLEPRENLIEGLWLEAMSPSLKKTPHFISAKFNARDFCNVFFQLFRASSKVLEDYTTTLFPLLFISPRNVAFIIMTTHNSSDSYMLS
ncbi:hypothetical protein EGR_00471 [Echinococcus granulosus]|uniref:Uncharacterized protein n=1 Tax=Echinococcus granulosus TaxID=6210 RepID=W6UV73_ECHGR|nr:hypothetical protein EGR_00471 [Echinococcus granulosus]EUB64521.1 hypothetical protein EGR_00471 [Echinococcus granulosus]